MQIMCIDDTSVSALNGKHLVLIFGKIYESTGEAYGLNNDECYIIPELPNSGIYGIKKKNNGPYYRKTRFIPLSDIDETELVNEKVKQYPLEPADCFDANDN